MVLGEGGTVLVTTRLTDWRKAGVTYLSPAMSILGYEVLEDREVSTVMAEGGASPWFAINYSDGTIISSSSDLTDMSLVSGKYLGEGKWVGSLPQQPSLVSVSSHGVALSTSSWAEPNGTEQATNSATLPRRGIFVKGHPIALGFMHTALRIVPWNQDYWRGFVAGPVSASGAEALVFTEHPDGYVYTTLGAGSSLDSCSGYLTSRFLRQRDWQVRALHLERLSYSPLEEDALIQLLVSLDDNYGDNLQYECWPDGGSDEYNSNGYVAGLLRAAGVPEPAFPYQLRHRYFGWAKPVPRAGFGVIP